MERGNKMPVKNWTREKPTESGWYWYRHSELAGIRIGYVPIQNQIHSFQFGSAQHELSELDGWWSPAIPPPFDGEDGE